MRQILLAFLAVTALGANARAEIINLQCTGFPRSADAMAGDNIALDTDRHLVKSLDNGYQWAPANFTDDTVNWNTRNPSGMFLFKISRATLEITQEVIEGGRSVYAGTGQCQKMPGNQF